MTAPAGSDAERATGYRADLDGLRAVAVLLIILFHVGVAGLPGGYVGVDVFFVISGFLITGLLVRELDQTGTLALREFYARRARRILPASFLVLGATLVGCVVFLSPVGLWRAAPDIAASAAYVPNLLFARDVTDYFHPARVSPVIHYWSLGVEEQFYVFYPAFLLVAHRLAARRGPRLVGYIGLAVAVSLALSVVFTASHPTAAFYLLPTRAWELGAGALLVFAGPRLRGLSAVQANAAAAVGIALIVSSAVLFGPSTPFPGVAGLVPVLGTVLVIAAGGATSTPWTSVVLAWAPVRYIGRISYSLYLWHWPIIVFGAIAFRGVVPDAAQSAAAIGLTALLAAATYRWVEDPMRHGRYIGRRPSRNLTAALGASVVIVVLALGGGKVATLRFERSVASESVPQGTDLLAGVLPANEPPVDGPLPADAIPSLMHLRRGALVQNPVRDGCSLLTGETVAGPCTYGNPASATKVVLFGDSHLNQWWPALERIVAERDWRVVYLIKTSCTYADVTAVTIAGPKEECDTWRKAVVARILTERPALVILSANHRAPPIVNGVVLQGSAAVAAMADGTARTIDTLQSSGARVVVIGDTPQVPFDPADCLSINADHVIRCAMPREMALDPAWLAAEQSAAERLGATFVDTAAWVCPSDPCPAIIGRFVVYADTNHLTRPFVAALTSRLDAAIPR
jgi:peptidoglycan/LPS O-acetylase OafA/YrhL